MNKSPIAAFFLSFIPGAGHAYLGRFVRAILYGGAFFGSLGLLFLLLVTNSGDSGISFFLLFVAAVGGIINMIDMIITLLSGKVPGVAGGPPPQMGSHSEAFTANGAYSVPLSMEMQREKSRTILLSFIPGLGHMSLGLMQRGITLLIAFVGLFAIIIFLSVIMNTGALLIFLLSLPVIWIYSMFDVNSHLHAKHRGEELRDQSVFEDMERHVASGRKNKVLAIALSIFPGAGHLYLGLQKRGLQLMGGFLMAIYIMDNMRLSLFFFLLPLFWCFAFFDALQQASRYERQELSDEPVLKQFVPYQKWFGIAMIGFGIYYLLNRVVASLVAKSFTNKIYQAYMEVIYVIPTVAISFVLIFLGLRLAFGSKEQATKQAISKLSKQAQGSEMQLDKVITDYKEGTK